MNPHFSLGSGIPILLQEVVVPVSRLFPLNLICRSPGFSAFPFSVLPLKVKERGKSYKLNKPIQY